MQSFSKSDTLNARPSTRTSSAKRFWVSCQINTGHLPASTAAAVTATTTTYTSITTTATSATLLQLLLLLMPGKTSVFSVKFSIPVVLLNTRRVLSYLVTEKQRRMNKLDEIKSQSLTDNSQL